MPRNLKKIEFELIDLIVISSYYFFCLLLFLSLTGLFKKELIGAGVIIFILLLVFFCRKVVFKKYYLYFFILIPLFFIGVLLFLGSFAGDAIYFWLPWAREIVLQQKMPDFLLESPVWTTSRMPLVPLFYAGIFGLLGFKASLATILSFFFAASTIFLLFQWLHEKGIDKKYIFFAALLILTNPIMLRFGGSLHQETFVLFFFTAFFYYLEKYQKTKSHLHFFLIFFSFVLASVSKVTGLILILPIVWLIIKNRPLKKEIGYLFLISLPLIIWFIRTYLIYGNPIYPFLNNLFKGPYYEVYLIINQIAQQVHPVFMGSVFAKLATLPYVFLLFCPFIILSFYGFWKERKIQYLALFLIFLLTILFIAPFHNYYRYLLPFLGLLAIYALAGLAELKSRIFLSFVFFTSLWGLFSTEIFFSRSEFFAPIEQNLAIFSQASQFFYNYGLILAAALGLFFYFFISQRSCAKYLILLLICSYLVKSDVVQIGSWLNVWLPILLLIFIIFIWKFLTKLNEETLRKLAIAYMIVLLVLSSWGLASIYFLAHRQVAFPNLKEAYGILPRVAETLGELEGENRDFYVYVASSGYLAWYHNYKVVTYETPTFHVITNLKYREDMSAEEIHDLFQASNIKYIVENGEKEQLRAFYDKIKSRPDLFERLQESLWQTSIKPAK